jgi:flagellar biosynthesis/type III secretory pathway chaperone
MDMNEKVETLMTVIDRLCGVIESENSNISTRQFKAIGETIEEKDKLCRAFELLVRGLSKDKHNMHETGTNTREALLQCGEKLDGLVSSNAAALKTAIQANERLMKAVRSAAIECTPKAGSYSKNGHLLAGSRLAEKAPSPVTVNQVL